MYKNPFNRGNILAKTVKEYNNRFLIKEAKRSSKIYEEFYNFLSKIYK